VGSITTFAEALNPVGLIEHAQAHVNGDNAERDTQESKAVASQRMAVVALERDALQQQVFFVCLLCPRCERACSLARSLTHSRTSARARSSVLARFLPPSHGAGGSAQA